MANIPIGTKGEQKLLVTSEVAISFLGLEGARVLSTPHMIGYMERTCRDTVLPLLDPGHDTVGTHVNVAHLAAAPMGMAVTFAGRVGVQVSTHTFVPIVTIVAVVADGPRLSITKSKAIGCP